MRSIIFMLINILCFSIGASAAVVCYESSDISDNMANKMVEDLLRNKTFTNKPYGESELLLNSLKQNSAFQTNDVERSSDCFSSP